jgi:hypothetical protein
VVDTPGGQKRCFLLSKSVAKKLGIITFHIAERAVYGIAQTKKGLSPKLQEVLEEYQGPVTQPYRLPPIHLEDKLIKVLDKWETAMQQKQSP